MLGRPVLSGNRRTSFAQPMGGTFFGKSRVAAPLLHPIAEAVKEIDLRASLYKATIDYENRKTSTSGLLRRVGRHVAAIFEKEKEPLDEGNAALVLQRAACPLRHPGECFVAATLAL